MHSQYFPESGPKFLIKLIQKIPKTSEGNTTKQKQTKKNPKTQWFLIEKQLHKRIQQKPELALYASPFHGLGKKSNQVDLGVLKSCHEWVGGTWVPPSLHIPASQKLFPAKTGACLTKKHISKTDICHLNSTLTIKPLENFTEQVVIMEIKSRAGNKLFHKFLNPFWHPKPGATGGCHSAMLRDERPERAGSAWATPFAEPHERISHQQIFI